MKELGYTPSKVDTDVYMRAVVKSNGEKYYEYVMCYMDDILCCGENTQSQMDAIHGKKNSRRLRRAPVLDLRPS